MHLRAFQVQCFVKLVWINLEQYNGRYFPGAAYHQKHKLLKHLWSRSWYWDLHVSMCTDESYFHERSACLHTHTRRFKVGQDDGEPSVIPCFYIPTLLPLQSSMHGWHWASHTLGGRDPHAVWDEGILQPACIPFVMHPPPCSPPLHFKKTDCLEDLSPKSWIQLDMRADRLIFLPCYFSIDSLCAKHNLHFFKSNTLGINDFVVVDKVITCKVDIYYVRESVKIYVYA